MNHDLTDDQLKELLEVAVQAAHAAATPIRAYFE